MEADEYNRTLRLTNIYRQILELTPFERGARELMRDPKVLRYLLLCLPLNENVVENIVLSLMFKLQSNMYFLHLMNQTLKCILKINEARLPTEDLAERQTGGMYEMDKRSDNFQEFVEKHVPVVVLINIYHIKQRCLEYVDKLVVLLETVACRSPELRRSLPQEERLPPRRLLRVLLPRLPQRGRHRVPGKGKPDLRALPEAPVPRQAPLQRRAEGAAAE